MAKHGRTRSLMVAAALGSAFLAACGAGSGKVSGSVVTGMALSDAPIGGGAVTLTDSSSSVQARQVTTRSDGSFTVDVSGLTPPYMLEVQWTGSGGTQAMHAVSDATESDVTPITDLAFDHAAGDTGDEALFRTASATRKRIAVNQATAVLTDVAAELAPLLNQYGIADLSTDTPAVRRLLQDVEVTQSSGMVTFSNRRTGGVIARGPRTNPTGGTFDPSQIPSSGSSGASSSGGTSSGGTSSGGSTSNGATLYASKCANCHGALASSGVKNTTASAIVAKHANLVTSTEADAIAAALSGSSGSSSGGASSGGTFDPCQMPTGAPPSSSGGSFDPSQMPTGAPPGSSGGSFDPSQMPTGAPPGSSGGSFDPSQMPTGAPPGSSGGASSGGFPSSGGMPPSGGCPIPGSSGGRSSGGASSGGTSGSTARLPPNHPAISSGATCSSCHTGGMAPGGAPGGVPGGGAPGGFPGSSSGASSGGTSSSGGTVSGNLPANHPSVPAGSACSSCH